MHATPGGGSHPVAASSQTRTVTTGTEPTTGCIPRLDANLAVCMPHRAAVATPGRGLLPRQPKAAGEEPGRTTPWLEPNLWCAVHRVATASRSGPPMPIRGSDAWEPASVPTWLPTSHRAAVACPVGECLHRVAAAFPVGRLSAWPKYQYRNGLLVPRWVSCYPCRGPPPGLPGQA